MRLKPTESQIQCAFVEYVERKYPFLSESLIKITNEGKRSLALGAKMKREGLRKGAADLFFSRPSVFNSPRGEVWHGLWCEVKKPGERPTKEQLRFLALQDSNNYFSFWSDNLDDIISNFEWYIDGINNDSGRDRKDFENQCSKTRCGL